MKSLIRGAAAATCVGLATTGAASAAEIFVTADIMTSTTWTSNNTYNLLDQIYVMPGATLTIEPGTVVASQTGLGGSLAVAKGAQIFINGTATQPVIMTSKADVATWDADPMHPTGKDPRSGNWREAANEWGNLTVMGAAYISENATAGNVPTCNANNVAAMEGLVADFPGDTKVLYGGGNDNDDSGAIRYLSLRYGGRVIGLNNELNGLSLGGIGRGTDIEGVDIMNNVDDGIEIWGGTVNIKRFNIWNIGDDSFDIDQGYRGQVQDGLIVQGYSLNAPQGSGVGDNCFETDGAEDSDWQPVTSTTIYNVTAIGQPVDGDQGTAWRDNARVQYRNCVFMDLGDQLIKNDNVDGDGANGYGHNGTLTWAQTWSTDVGAVPPHANDCPPGTYMGQLPGKLAEMRDSCFFRNLNSSAYTEADARGVTPPNAGNANFRLPGFAIVDEPILEVLRGPAVVKGGKTMLPVTSLDPTPKPGKGADTSAAAAPSNGFFEPQMYRGGFAPSEDPWICSWTASAAFGFVDQCDPVDSGAPACFGDGSGAPCACSNNGAAGEGCANSTGAGAVLAGSGNPSFSNDTFELTATQLPSGPGLMFQGNNLIASPPTFGDGIRCCGGGVVRWITVTSAGGCASSNQPSGCGNQVGGAGGPITQHPGNGGLQPGDTRCYQHWYRNPGAGNPCQGDFFNLSNAWVVTFQP